MKRFKIIFFMMFFAFVFIPTQISSASPVQEQLKITIDQILDILRDPCFAGNDNADSRREALREVVSQRFNFTKMSQLCLAKHWKPRSDEEKTTFTNMFGQLLENTYISKIESYTNEEVVYVKEYVKKKKAQVNTKIITSAVEIPIDYRLYQTKDGSWMIYDLIIEGVSLVRNYRSQFNEILQKNSFDVLVEELRKKTDVGNVQKSVPQSPTPNLE